MFSKLESIRQNYQELNKQLYDNDILQNPQKMREINQKIGEIEDINRLYEEYLSNDKKLAEAKFILETENDPELMDLAKIELSQAQETKKILEENLKISLLPRDINDDKNIYLEIRPAAGGQEASLFGAELMRMYLRFAELKSWKNEIIEHQQSDLGGLKFTLIKISGHKVYSKLKFESGVHRVQRIPTTESCGRIHTSTVTVAVLPEIEDIEIKLNADDIDMDTYAASSAGGQHANKNETGVRLHHKPTGIIVNVGDSRSQLQNKEKAYKVLKAKLYQLEINKQQSEVKSERLNQIGTGDRSEKIRTYNYPQDRITDHRIKQSWSNLLNILEGNLDDIVSALIIENQAKLLATQKN